jgi:hypothetical protein
VGAFLNQPGAPEASSVLRMDGDPSALREGWSRGSTGRMHGLVIARSMRDEAIHPQVILLGAMSSRSELTAHWFSQQSAAVINRL